MFMLGSHSQRGGNSAPSLKPASIHETVTYPRIKPVTAENNPCLNPNMVNEHILACGHLINTVKPYEPCAPNCHHIQNSKSEKTKEHARAVNSKEFYCDACVEAINETFLPESANSTQAEHMRGMMRGTEALNRRKDTKYRKCYIAFKVTSVPCHSDGSLRSRYVPRAEHHPFDTSLPQIGENIFEDIEVIPPKAPIQKKKAEMPQNETATSSGEVTEDDMRSQEEVARTKTTLVTPSAATTMREPGSNTRFALSAPPAQSKGATHQPRTANRAVRNSPSVIIPSTQHKPSSQVANVTPKPAPKPAQKRKRSVTDEPNSKSDKENQVTAPRPAKRTKATPSVPSAVPVTNKPKATPRRSMRLSSKKN